MAGTRRSLCAFLGLRPSAVARFVRTAAARASAVPLHRSALHSILNCELLTHVAKDSTVKHASAQDVQGRRQRRWRRWVLVGRVAGRPGACLDHIQLLLGSDRRGEKRDGRAKGDGKLLRKSPRRHPRRPIGHDRCATAQSKRQRGLLGGRPPHERHGAPSAAVRLLTICLPRSAPISRSEKPTDAAGCSR